MSYRGRVSERPQASRRSAELREEGEVRPLRDRLRRARSDAGWPGAQPAHEVELAESGDAQAAVPLGGPAGASARSRRSLRPPTPARAWRGVERPARGSWAST